MTDLSASLPENDNLPQNTTPAGVQPMPLLMWRRLFFGAAFVGTTATLLEGLWAGLGLGAGAGVGEKAIFALALVGVPWTVIGFLNAGIGLWLFLWHGAEGGVMSAAPFMAWADRPAALSVRVAVLLTLRNEDAARAMARLLAVRESLDATGQGAAFDYYVLSDTSDVLIAAQEQAECARFRDRFGEATAARLTYRRREVNAGFKAGNVRDFLERWGEAYELMLPLDADSVMSGEAIVRMTRIAQALPKLGILQSLVVGTPSASAFARLFQFGMRLGMRSYTLGSAWWTGDCGPFWGHNALVRIKPFKDACALPLLPGKPPFGGPILSHDQIEAAMMRAAGYEVRVVPSELPGGSYEDNPPALLEFLRRDARWCQGNLQYGRLLFMPGLRAISRMQIALAFWMFFSRAAWTSIGALTLVMVAAESFSHVDAKTLTDEIVLFFILSFAPKIAGFSISCVSLPEAKSFGGRWRLIGGIAIETVFSTLLTPIMIVNSTVFMGSLAVLGRGVSWSGQVRDPRRVSWTEAARALWPQTLMGGVFAAVFAVKAPEGLLWSAPIWAGLVLAIPLAVITASPQAGRYLARFRMCGLPEEFEQTEILQNMTYQQQSV